MSVQPFTIQPLRSSIALEAAVQLFQAYADSLDVDLAYQDFATELSTLPGKYAPPDGELLLAWDWAGQALGCVALRPLSVPGVCEMKRLYVLPQARGLGVGQALIKAIIQQARRMGYHRMCLDTLPSMARAIALYQKLGFVSIAPHYDSPVSDTLFLGLELDEASLREGCIYE